jgi:hypothetical protein
MAVLVAEDFSGRYQAFIESDENLVGARGFSIGVSTGARSSSLLLGQGGD